MKFKIDLFDGYRAGNTLLGSGIYRVPEDMDEALAEKLVSDALAVKIGGEKPKPVEQTAVIEPAPEIEAAEEAEAAPVADVAVQEAAPEPKHFRAPPRNYKQDNRKK